MKQLTTPPRARREGLLMQELPHELLIYDTERHKAHCLNPTAAFIWKHCDGNTSVAEIARRLEKSLKTIVDEDVVWFALSQLEKDHLLEEKLAWPAGANRISRRELVRRLGIGAAIAVPIITSIVAPTAAYAGSGPNTGAPCSGPQDCTGGTNCVSGHCI
jgi:hypothetical protein